MDDPTNPARENREVNLLGKLYPTTEKERRIYYQSIVYAVCDILDAHCGKSVANGTNIITGTVEHPSTEVVDTLLKVLSNTEREGVIGVRVDISVKAAASFVGGIEKYVHLCVEQAESSLVDKVRAAAQNP